VIPGVRRAEITVLVRPDKIKAFIFDLDGVITDTASLHTAAWKRMFDEYLRERSKRYGVPFRPFTKADYRRYVDGKPRFDGARDFLASRHIHLPQGTSKDPPDKETIWGLGRRKNGYYLELLRKKGPNVYQTSIDFLRLIRKSGIKTAIISSSKNASQVLRLAKVRRLFDVKVDGRDLETLGIPGKPDPAMFLEAAARLKAKPGESAVVEDALAGVEAGRRGGFGMVIGVARTQDSRELKKHGADATVADLKELKLAGEARR
jgi:trehalose 6-phosphate phosphatase